MLVSRTKRPAALSGAAAAKRARAAANGALAVGVIVAVSLAVVTGRSLYLLWLAVGTVVAFGLFAFDKRQARRGGWRIAERALLGSIVGGGVLGGWLGMLSLRHKTRHDRFWIVLGGASVLHVSLIWVVVLR